MTRVGVFPFSTTSTSATADGLDGALVLWNQLDTYSGFSALLHCGAGEEEEEKKEEKEEKEEEKEE